MVSSCGESLTDININPNKSGSANPEQVLSSAQAFMGWTIDGQWNVRSAIWGQYWTWGPGVAIGNIERYQSDGADYDNGWARMYNGALADLDFVSKSGLKSHAGIAKLLMAYNYQLLVDHFGDVPFSEALKGNNDYIFSPHYDKDSDIYASLLTMVDDGLKDIKADANTVSSEDFIYNGDLNKWVKFGNSLKLKLLMRQSTVNDVSVAVKELISTGSFIETADDIAAMPFSGVSGSENPMYATFERSLGLFYIASSSSMGYLKAKNDPRLSAFYDVAPKSGTYVSIDQGTIDEEPFTNSKEFYSRATGVVYAKDNSVIFMSPWEVWFYRAEASVRFGTADNAASAFGNAIVQNFNHLGVAGGADYATILDFNGAVDNAAKLQLIGTQKWVSMNGLQEDEGWIESRRFDTAANPFFTKAGSGLFKKPILSVLPDGVHPSIWLYPATEKSLNSNTPSSRSLTDKVFWDN